MSLNDDPEWQRICREMDESHTDLRDAIAVLRAQADQLQAENAETELVRGMTARERLDGVLAPQLGRWIEELR